MRRLVAEMRSAPDGTLFPILHARTQAEELDVPLTSTLLAVVTEAYGPALEELDSLLQAAEAGTYEPSDRSSCDWSINDKEGWIRPPWAQPGGLCIGNAYVEEVSFESGIPQRFSAAEFRAVSTFWRRFKHTIAAKRPDGLEDFRIEQTTPWPVDV